MDHIIYEDAPKYSRWLKIFSLLFLVIVAAGIIYRVLIIGTKSTEAIADTLTLLAFCILFGILFWSTLDHKYLIFEDRLKIVRGRLFSTIIRFNSIAEANEVSGEDLHFATGYSSKNAIRIIRLSKSATIIYPSNSEEFLGHLNKALTEWKSKIKVDDKTNQLNRRAK